MITRKLNYKSITIMYLEKEINTWELNNLLLNDQEKKDETTKEIKIYFELDLRRSSEDGGELGGSGVHFPSTPVKYLADLRSRANSQQYSSIYEDRRPKIENTERSDGKKSA